MKKSYKDYLFKIRELLEIFATTSSIATATVIVLQILKIITVTSLLLPLPLVIAGLYLAVKILPIGVKTIKKQLLKRTNESMTEEEILELEELKSIIDDKCTTFRGSSRTEPISNFSTIGV